MTKTQLPLVEPARRLELTITRALGCMESPTVTIYDGAGLFTNESAGAGVVYYPNGVDGRTFMDGRSMNATVVSAYDGARAVAAGKKQR